MDERITGILVRLCLLFGAKRLADLLTVSEENSETEEKFLEAFTRFIEKLEKYHEFIDDFQYALKSSKEGLKSTSLEDMETYVADETRFLMNMVKKFNTKLKNDLINDIKKS